MAICEAEASSAADGRPAIISPALAGSGDRNYVDVAGIHIDCLTRAEVRSRIVELVQSGRPHQVVTVNTDFLNIGHRDPGFIDLLNAAAVSVPDGMPLLWLSQLLGRPLPERITGTDLLMDSAGLAAEHGWSLFLLGAAPGVAQEAARRLSERFPGLRIAGTYSPPIYEGRNRLLEARMVDVVRAARPDMLFVAMGAPKQECWIYEELEALGVPVCIGIGGVLNFITGRIPRAPQMLQRAGLEWLFRLVLEPRRLWRRYLVEDTQALMRVLIYHRGAAVRRRPAASPVPAAPPRPPTLAADWPFAPAAVPTAPRADGAEWMIVPESTVVE